MALLSLHNVTLSHGGPPLLDQVSIQIERGERACLLGRNGAGKTTLMRLLCGEIEPDKGTISLQKGARIAYLAQEVPEGIEGTVRDIVSTPPENDEATYHDPPSHHQVNTVLTRLKLDADVDFSTLSGGLKRRVMLARALACEPDVLLLDEPTNHLDIDSIEWLEEFLRRYVPTLLFVTHDRVFLRKLATRILELDRGKLTSSTCDYDTFLQRQDAMMDVEAKQDALFDKRLAEEEVWVRKGLKARTNRNEGRVRALEQMRRERQERRTRGGTVAMQVQSAKRSGHLVFEAQDATFSYEGRAIIKDLTTIIMRGDKVGIIGANGSGKTTLLRLLLGQLEPQSGEVQLGTRLQIAYADQLRAQLDGEKSVRENVAGENDTVTFNGQQRHIIGYLQEFLFSPERARTPVSALSGGERNRLLLAKLFTQPANLLVLDEPTNDLDIETLELLESLLVDFTGTLLLVSHDRAFLNDVVTSTLALDGQGGVAEYVGGYDDWLRQRPKQTDANGQSLSGKSARGETKSRVRKLSFKEKSELETLPQRIESLETEHGLLIAKMADPKFYKSQGGAVADAQARLESVERELASSFARWEQLDALNAVPAV